MNVASYVQAERILRIETPLGADVLLPERMEMREAMNALFELSIAVRSKRTDLKPEELVGKLVDVSVEAGLGERRSWNGLVVALSEGPMVTRGLRSYHLTIVPQHWLMTQKSDCRIWLDKTAVDVARTLLSEHGLHAPVTSGVIDEPKPQHYSVQWNETDLDYLTRRLEEDGIFYWFEHEPGKHTMHIASDVSGYTEGPETDVRYALGSTDRNHISKFDKTFRFVPGKRAAADWNFLSPGQVPTGETPSLVSLPGNDAYELFEYPMLSGYGTGSKASDGIEGDQVERQSKLRMQATEAEHERIEGEATIRTLAPGRRFKPYDVANPGNVFAEHVVFQIWHEARDRSYETNEGDPEYSNRFVALPSRVPATPHRTTQRPRIDGTQVAIIAGPAGEEIHTDQHGRVKVWFPWDRRAKKDGSDTCWVRVVQNWGGGTWGGQIVPRIEMEAIVSYLDGAPDRPVIIGIVPNARNKVPYTLPDNKTRSTFRTNTHKGTGFNEFTTEDKTGEEIMFFHAQKDHTSRVLNTRTARVDKHDVYSVGGNRAVEVAKNQKHEVGGSLNLTVGGTGMGALGALSGVMGLAGQTAGLLQQAGQLAGGGGPALGAFGLTLASSALGFLSGGGLGAREGVVSGPNPRQDAGVALTGSGTGMGEDAGGFFPLPGIMNTIVQSFQSTSVGVAQVQQIGLSKVTNVGQTHVESIGKQQNITIGKEQHTDIGEKQYTTVGKEQHNTVGELINVEVGKLYKLVSGEKFHGEAKTWEIFADDEIRLSAPGGYITINKKGIKLYALKIDIEGNQINFKKGGPGKGASCLKKMSQSSTPFVRM